MTLVVSGDELLAIDLRERTVRSIFRSPDIRAVSIFQRPTPIDERPANEQAGRSDVSSGGPMELAVLTADRVVTLDASGKQTGSYVLPPEVRSSGFQFSVSREGTATAVVSPTYGLSPSFSTSVLNFDASGTIIRRANVTPSGESSSLSATIGVSLIFPVLMAALFLIGYAIPIDHLNYGRADTFATAFARAFGEFWPFFAITLIIGVVAAAVYRRRQKQFALPMQPAWIAFLILGGLPALAGYYWHRRWPVRLPCPACGTSVPRDREMCSECAAEFPPPPRNGLEIMPASEVFA
jgi:hypothetical protein